MSDFTTWFSQYWRYVIGLIGVCIVAFFVLRAASRSYKRYYKRYHEQEAQIKRLVALKEKYQILTEQTIAEAPEAELLEGVAMSYQLMLQKEDDMTARFDLMTDERKYMYALDVFTQDKSLQVFFKENGSALTQIIIPAMKRIGLEEAADIAEEIRLMYDETDETTSISQSRIEEAEKYFEDNGILTKIKLNAARYIKENAELFI